MKATAIKTIQSVTKELVLRALGWNELQYGEFQFEQGLVYLQRYCGDDEEIISLYSQHAMFWKWYRNHWHNRDHEFLRDCKRMSMSERISQYKALHDMKGFRYKPHRIVMDMSIYKEVIYPSTHDEGVLV